MMMILVVLSFHGRLSQLTAFWLTTQCGIQIEILAPFLSNNFAVTWTLKGEKTLHSYPQTQHSAAEIFDGGNGETQTTSPAIPWAAFPTVSGVHLSPASPEIILDHDHSSPSVGCLSSEPIISSPENTHTDDSIVSQTVPKAQIQQSTHTHLDISLFPLGLNDEKSNGTIALVDDSEDLGVNVSNIQLQQKISSLEIKLKVSEEEKQRIKKDVESLMEKHSVLEKDFLKEKEQEAISFQDRYKELQDKHKQELEDMRKAGHEALSIIVDEYKHQRLLEMLDTEKELLKEKIKEALIQQSQEQKVILEKCLEEERQRNKEALLSAAKLEKEAMKDAVLKAIEEERKNMEKAHAEERELWKTEHAKDQEEVSQAIQKAIQEQRKISQETVKAAIIEEQKRSEKAVEEAVKRTRDELIEYVKEQKRLDQVIRQRSLSSLELFLSCAQKQLSALIATEPVDIE
ncbi:coiled-coil domain-containing protein 91 isoform X2 [Acinonyx jubatus]|uniref:Coiled-coil domain-containing protein 91 isoform X2 n=1 Tax=Acinonyx jubatus TaxID=32536 RepID=A0ABM3QDQ1_ACIJB|nr:coiled-coil domain-containing protein 91 isoform X2 [Acinonyx jubatus]